MAWYYGVIMVSLGLVFFAGAALAVRYSVIKPRIKTLLLDADGTLLDFDRSEKAAFRETLQQLGYPYDEKAYHCYHKNNASCWKALERKEISRAELKVRRYRMTFDELGISVDPALATRIYEEKLGQIGFAFDGAEEACRRLGRKYALYIVTNGLKNVQTSRLLKTRIPELVKGIYISEDVGYDKPSPEFFDFFFREHPECKRQETMIVGDSLSGDISGGNNAGIYTCWVNRTGEIPPGDLSIYLEITDITQLEKVL